MHRKTQGFTIIELIIVVTVVGITLALAMPSYTDVINKRAVTNAAEQVSLFMATARSESVKRNESISITFDDTNAEFCVGMNDTAAACDCLSDTTTDSDYCGFTDVEAGNDVITGFFLRGRNYSTLQSPELTANGSADTALLLTFDPTRGVLDTVNDDNGQILITSENDRYALRVNISVSGRIALCTPGGKPVPGYKTCS